MAWGDAGKPLKFLLRKHRLPKAKDSTGLPHFSWQNANQSNSLAHAHFWPWQSSPIFDQVKGI